MKFVSSYHSRIGLHSVRFKDRRELSSHSSGTNSNAGDLKWNPELYKSHACPAKDEHANDAYKIKFYPECKHATAALIGLVLELVRHDSMLNCFACRFWIHVVSHNDSGSSRIMSLD